MHSFKKHLPSQNATKECTMSRTSCMMSNFTSQWFLTKCTCSSDIDHIHGCTEMEEEAEEDEKKDENDTITTL